MKTDIDHIVIGAGISGLGAAHFAVQRGHSTLVLESSGRIGGCLNTQRFESLGGFWVEAGGHTCFNSYGHLLGILDDLGLTARVQAKTKVGYALWREGRRRSILSALHPWEALRALPRLFSAPKTDRAVADYYGEVLGRRNYDSLLRHAFQAVICQPADDYPAEILFRRKPRRKDVIKAFTFARGLSTLPETIAGQDGLDVRTGQSVTGIETLAAGYRVRLGTGETLTAGALTLAVPPDVAAGLIPGDWPEARAAIAEIGMAELDTLVLAFESADLGLKPMAGLIAVDAPFYSCVSRDFLPDPTYRGFAFHFRPDAGSEDARIAAACASLGVQPARVRAQTWVRNRLPALRVGHAGRIARLDRALAGQRFAVVGNWFLGVSIEDALTRAHAESDRLFGPAVGSVRG